MSYKTIETYVNVEVELDRWTNDELIEELKLRGYDCVKDHSDLGFDRDDWQYLLELIDKQPENWYNRRIRDKILFARFGV